MLRRLAWILLAATLGWTVRHALSSTFDDHALAPRRAPSPTLPASESTSPCERKPHQSCILDGIVVYVDDGDTIILTDDNGRKHRIRLANIDAPEIAHPRMPAQPYGYEAKAFLAEQIRGKRVQVYVSDRDQYGREIGDIRLDGQDIDLLMVQHGLAWAYRQYLPADQADTYLAAEEAAKSNRLGLWADPSPTPPWEWRHSHR